MQPANHGNAKCISYRFEEMSTGKVFVFCTDHEDEVGIPADFSRHLSNADLVIMDAQYDQKRYMTKTARYGHGTPHGVMKQALASGVKRVGLTHHDPHSTDEFLQDVIIGEAKHVLQELKNNKEFTETFGIDINKKLISENDIFLCVDYNLIEV
jgi:ribonuclease BN (tRNA processing enzyme)